VLRALILALLTAAIAVSEAPVYTFRVVKTYPHDPSAFTQGLIYLDGFLYEGTGMNGHSNLRKVNLETGKVLQEKKIEQQYFGEGITNWGSQLIQLTWQHGVGFVWDRSTFQLKKQFKYTGEGWGLTHDTKQLILSDGSPVLRLLDPETLAEKGRLPVLDGRRPISNLNELEWVKGEIWANIWQTEKIVRISPQNGQVLGWVDMTGILPAADRANVDVLNGIAYDEKKDRLFVTGKWWPKLFEIKVVPR
jgi:glutaminyl-peptide cyclotransferase